MRGIRSRLTSTLLALVALTASVLGIGSYLVVDYGLHTQVREDAADQARFDLSVLIPDRLPAAPTLDDVVASRLGDTFHLRGVEAIVDLGQDDPYVSTNALLGALDQLPGDLKARVATGELAYAWTTVAGSPALVVGGRLVPSGPDFYFVHDTTELETTLGQLRLALGGGALALVLIALLAARAIARGVLSPVEAAGRAAERIERGDLSARVAVTSRDEFGVWAERFNRMAEALGETIGRLEAAQAQNRRFVADVSHELRTPLGALVAEASILREHLDGLPPDGRRAGELLVADVARMRVLVEDLMELSRFDAEAERVALEPVDLGRLVAAVARARLPDADLGLPESPLVVESEPRRLERIVGNLLDNAREHAPGARVEVVVAVDGDDAVVSVADAGPGVASDRLGHIFERFYKADPSRHEGGSGLGLAIAAEHAALLGGRLRAANRTGGGLRIELRLSHAQVRVTEPLRDGDRIAIRAVDDGAPTTAQEPRP
jgi:two-component system sensor histidine kinase MtrB